MPIRDFPAGALGERARAYLDGALTDPPATPRLAATVQLLRDGADGLEVFVLRRVASMAFAPSVLVFPGGGVDPRDADGMPLGFGPSADEWAQRFRLVDADATAEQRDAAHGLADSIVAAAAREVFEETGILLASPSVAPPETGADPTAADAPRQAGPVVDGRDLATERRACEARALAFSDLLEQRSLGLRRDLLSYRAHWVTPAFEPRRYDTYFFAAVVPDGQEPDGDTSEADDARWVRPADALDEHARGEVAMLPPTIASLEDLARFERAADVLRDEPRVPRIEPTLARVGDEVVIRVETERPA